MELSIREAAAILGRSPRTVRAQVTRGDLPGVKRNGRWRVSRQGLPLTEAQRAALQAKADTLRDALEGALPSRLARTQGQRHRSIADLEAFRLGAKLLAEVRAAGPEVLGPLFATRVVGLLERSLLALAEAVQQFDREMKLAAVHRARADLARATATLLLADRIPPAEPVFSWVAALEGEVVPAVAGFARWAEGLRGRSR